MRKDNIPIVSPVGLRDLLVAAGKWWESKRPTSYSNADHLLNPTVNTTTDSEKELAIAYSNIVRLH